MPRQPLLADDAALIVVGARRSTQEIIDASAVLAAGRALTPAGAAR
jgi:hypothetical protein